MYTIINDTTNGTYLIRREADSAFIPPNPENADYQSFERWVAEGNEPARVEL